VTALPLPRLSQLLGCVQKAQAPQLWLLLLTSIHAIKGNISLFKDELASCPSGEVVVRDDVSRLVSKVGWQQATFSLCTCGPGQVAAPSIASSPELKAWWRRSRTPNGARGLCFRPVSALRQAVPASLLPFCRRSLQANPAEQWVVLRFTAQACHQFAALGISLTLSLGRITEHVGPRTDDAAVPPLAALQQYAFLSFPSAWGALSLSGSGSVARLSCGSLDEALDAVDEEMRGHGSGHGLSRGDRISSLLPPWRPRLLPTLRVKMQAGRNTPVSALFCFPVRRDARGAPGASSQ